MKAATSLGSIVLLVCSVVPAEAQTPVVPTFDPEDPRTSFTAMAEYLSAAGGQWRSPNPNYDASRPASPPAFGLWFVWVAERRVLELSIVVHHADSSTTLSSKGQWVWHPGESRLTYLMIGRNGSVTEGTTAFTEPSTFTTVATFFRPNGRSSETRDENVLVSGSIHRNETFEPDQDGTWQSRGVYEWRRVRSRSGLNRSEPGSLTPDARESRSRSRNQRFGNRIGSIQ